ncbi:MAG TPA: shikimate dehydrogenase [Polyangiaceae bacterium]|nr:shikimate dehydrogenase [Polyangiaceae bacterium]
MAQPTTILCGSLSLHPVSLGAAMHRAGYSALGLDYSYVPFKISDVKGALTGMRALGIRGFGVSMPFKLEVIPELDHLDELAARIGAVNTIVNDAGVLTGYNTDASGAARALGEVLPFAGQRICLIGAGGAARAVAYALCSEGLSVHIVNRTAAGAERLAGELRDRYGWPASAGSLAELADLRSFAALVNASSAGMLEYGADSPVPAQTLHRDLVVMDIVYKPLRTTLIESAERAGARTVHGGRMLLHQACRQFELYTGQCAPVAEMDRALCAHSDAQG